MLAAHSRQDVGVGLVLRKLKGAGLCVRQIVEQGSLATSASIHYQLFRSADGLEIQMPSALAKQVKQQPSIQPGDILTAVNGQSVAEMSANQVKPLILGPKNSEVTLCFQRLLPDGLWLGITATAKRSDEEQFGIGVTFKKDTDGRLRVKSLVPGGPAQQTQNIFVNDVLVAIDSKNVLAMPPSSFMHLLKGPMGSTVDIRFMRDESNEERVVRIARGPISSQDSSSHIGAPQEPTEGENNWRRGGAATTTGADAAIPEEYDFDKDKGALQKLEGKKSSQANGNIGAIFRGVSGQGFVLKDVTPASPADGAKSAHGIELEIEDKLLSIDGISTDGLFYQDLEALLRGEPGTQVELSMQKPRQIGEEMGLAYSIQITRKLIQKPVGVGITFRVDEKGVARVQSMAVGSPAEESGRVYNGDGLISINDRTVFKKPLVEAQRLLFGQPGTFVKLLLQRENGATEEVELQRRHVKISKPHALRGEPDSGMRANSTSSWHPNQYEKAHSQRRLRQLRTEYQAVLEQSMRLSSQADAKRKEVLAIQTIKKQEGDNNKQLRELSRKTNMSEIDIDEEIESSRERILSLEQEKQRLQETAGSAEQRLKSVQRAIKETIDARRELHVQIASLMGKTSAN